MEKGLLELTSDIPMRIWHICAFRDNYQFATRFNMNKLNTHTLRRQTDHCVKLHLISWCVNFVERQFPHSFGRIGRNCAFPQNLHTRKLGETTLIYAVWISALSYLKGLDCSSLFENAYTFYRITLNHTRPHYVITFFHFISSLHSQVPLVSFLVLATLSVCFHLCLIM